MWIKTYLKGQISFLLNVSVQQTRVILGPEVFYIYVSF